MSPSVHPTAALGFVTPDVYERGRPDYAQAAVDVLGLGPRQRVADIGCGTGKFTRQLIATGADVIGIEPLPTMLTGLAAALPEVKAAAGLAEQLPLADGCIDMVTCASAFHLFDHDRALPELHRVLCPDGTLAIVWNRRDTLPAGTWANDFFAITERHRGDTPGYRSGAWERAIADSDLFGPITAAYFDHTQRTDMDGLIARIESISFIETLPATEKQALLDETWRFIETHPDTRGRATFDVPYRTSVYTTRTLGRPDGS